MAWRRPVAHGGGVRPELRELVERAGGVVTLRHACEVVPEWAVDNAHRSGNLRRVLPGVYLAPEAVGDPVALRRAVLAWADGRGALSHTTALETWGVRRAVPGEPVHLTVPDGSGMRSRPGVAVHHLIGFAPEPPRVRRRNGLVVTPVEESLVASWPLLRADDRRAPVIAAVNGRLTTPQRIDAALARAPRLAGRGELRHVLDLLAAGCRSPLEIFGHEHVFTGPGMPTFRRQVRVRVGRRTMELDVFAERELVNIELDGTAWHGDRRSRERDLRRDTLLATLGIRVVRFTHHRLVHETGSVRRAILAILASHPGVAGPHLMIH